uniref:Uncharacterized protein n=1 Tax=Ananas comosus var. bracteatus TaxID=296719 RepID=A0A6V7NTE3_ANACO|nr:unnamed protein product [Ananas comosus var. bracteatus]
MSNIVPVRKKNDKLRVCIDFRNWNLAIPKDEYQMPIVDMLIVSIEYRYHTGEYQYPSIIFLTAALGLRLLMLGTGTALAWYRYSRVGAVCTMETTVGVRIDVDVAPGSRSSVRASW